MRVMLIVYVFCLFFLLSIILDNFIWFGLLQMHFDMCRKYPQYIIFYSLGGLIDLVILFMMNE